MNNNGFVIKIHRNIPEQLKKFWNECANVNNEGDSKNIIDKEEAKANLSSIFFVEENMTENQFYEKNIDIATEGNSYCLHSDYNGTRRQYAVSAIVNEILDNNIIVDGYDEFIETLKEMEKLSSILSDEKTRRGFIFFNDDDVLFDMDENGVIINITGRNRGTSEEMIENFMLLANEMVASTYITLPFIYRIHPSPSSAALKEIIEYINTIDKGIKISKNFSNPKVIQGLLNKTKRLNEKDIISDAILRAMKKASYSCDNIGHFGLALSNYTHFTSPIRRFPDLMVHTLIDKYNSYFDVNLLDDLYVDLKKACINSSYKEKQAEITERQLHRYKMAEFMENNIGNTFNGYIYYVNSNHLTVKLDNMVIGKVNINDIGDNPYYEPSTNCIITDSCVYKIGSRISVIVKSADKDTGSVSFKLEKQKIKHKI